MRQRLLPLVIGGVVTLGILVGAIWFQTRSDDGRVAETAPETAATPDAGATGEEAAPAALPETNRNPDLTPDTSGLSKANVVLVTSQGTVRFKFYPQEAPATVARVIELVNQGFYNGLLFHRVVPGFVVQTGDPKGTGRGGSGQNLKAEFNKRQHQAGTVGMARAADPDSADSQFYITLSPQPHLDGNYTVFGMVTEGMDVVRKLQIGDRLTAAYVE